MAGMTKMSDSNSLNYIKSYRFNSIYMKNLLRILATVVLPFFIVTCLALFLYNNYQEKQTTAAFEKDSVRLSSNINSMLDDVKTKAIILGANRNLNSVIVHFDNKESIINEIVNLSDTLSVYKTSSGVIDSIYIYFPNDEFVISQAGASAKSSFFDTMCIDAMTADGATFDFRYLERTVNNKSKKTLTMFYRCLVPQNQIVLIIVNMDVKKIRNFLNYSEDTTVTLSSGDYLLYSDSFLLPSSYQNINDGATLSATMDVGSGLTLQIEALYPPYSEEILMIRRIFLITIALSILTSLVLVFFISKQIYSPIRDIMDVLSKKDLFPVEEKKLLQNSNELQYIIGSITASAQSKRIAENELVEKISLLKKAQAIALQSQINPHFLNNTLETINWMAIKQLGSENDVSAMINALATLLQMSLANTDVFSTIKDEKRMAETYLFIQKRRLSGRIQVEWDIPDYLMNCKIVNVVLQPIIENAIKYGMPSMDGVNFLTIRATEENGIVTLAVSDAGLGLLPEECKKISDSIRGNVLKESKHIGLSNVHQRLVLAFGEKYGVFFSSQIGIGTTVSITIPYQVV